MSAPIAFASYARSDDEHDNGAIVKFCNRLRGEVRAQSGHDRFELFIDRDDIQWGQTWRQRIDQELDTAAFLIPFLTPTYFKSGECLRELVRFRKLEATRGRNDLILPVYYIEDRMFSKKSDAASEQLEEVFAFFRSRQYTDWRELRYLGLEDPKCRRRLGELAAQLNEAIDRRVSVSLTGGAMGSPTRELVVDQTNEGHYQTIQEAIDIAGGGDKIVLVNDRYELSPTVVSKSVDIVGRCSSGPPALTSDGDFGFHLTAPSASLRDLAIDFRGEGKAAVICESPRCLVRDCSIKAGDCPCIWICSGSTPTIRSCELTDAQYALVAEGDTRALIENCHIDRIRLAAAYLLYRGSPTFRGNRFGAVPADIWSMFNDATPTLVDNEFADGVRRFDPGDRKRAAVVDNDDWM